MLIQCLLIDKTLQDGKMVHLQGKHTPYPNEEDYNHPKYKYTVLMDTRPKKKQIVGDQRYITYCTGPDISYFFESLGAAMSKPTTMNGA